MAGCDYANARAAARRARLLGDRGLRELLARPGTPERLAALSEGTWRRALHAVAGSREDALHQAARGLVLDPAEEAAQVLRFLDGRPRRLVAALLRLDDAPALEAVLRGLVRRDPRGSILAHAWPSPGLGPALIAELAGLPGPERVPEILARRSSPLAPAAAAALAAARTEPRLQRLGLALRRAVIEGVRAELSGHGEDVGVARAVLARHVDHLDAITLLAVEVMERPGELFVPGGHLDAAAFTRLAALPLAARRPRVAALVGLGGRRGPDPEVLREPAVAEQWLERVRERALHREARERPLSVAVPLAHLAARAAEARRVRVLLLGAEHGLPPDALLDLVEA